MNNDFFDDIGPKSSNLDSELIKKLNSKTNSGTITGTGEQLFVGHHEPKEME